MMELPAGSTVVSILMACLWFLMAAMKVESEFYKRPTSPWFPRENGVTCIVWNQTGCSTGECCVKEVISFKDLDKNMVVSTRCKPFLRLGELCLRQPEGYLCECQHGLRCDFRRNETYGHCAPG